MTVGLTTLLVLVVLPESQSFFFDREWPPSKYIAFAENKGALHGVQELRQPLGARVGRLLAFPALPSSPPLATPPPQ